MKITCIVILVTLAAWPCAGQSFIFDDCASASDFAIRKDEGHLICFYKTTNSDATTSRYRTIAFNSNLEITDTTGYAIPGVCNSLESGENGNYEFHIFHTTIGEKEVLTFLITDRAGKVLATYEKNEVEILKLFGKKFKKPGRIRFRAIPTKGEDSDLLILEPGYYTKAGAFSELGVLTAFNIMDGSVRWQFPRPVAFEKATALKGTLVMLTVNNPGAYQINYYNLLNGLQTAFVGPPANRNQNLSVFEVNGDEVIIAGSDANKNDNSNKHNRFFITRYDLKAAKILSVVDTASRLEANRLKLLGGSIDPDGNLILLGESYKNDATAKVAGVAASVALSIAFGVPRVMTPPVQTIILGIVGAKISLQGEVKEFHVFPVEKRNSFSQVINDDRQIFFRYKSQLLWYDLSNMSSPPKRYTTLTENQEVITFAGNLIGIKTDDKKQEIVLENIVSQ